MDTSSTRRHLHTTTSDFTSYQNCLGTDDNEMPGTSPQRALTHGLSGRVPTCFASPGVRSIAPFANREEEEDDTEAHQPWEEGRGGHSHPE